MKTLLFIFLGCILLFTFCSPREQELDKDSFYVLVNLFDNDRSGKDYVKLWVNDSLFFSGSYFTNYNEETYENIDDVLGMEVATFNKQGIDSVKIKLCLISLDTLLFEGKRVVDTTFYYKISNIPGIVISDTWRVGHFSVFDTLVAPGYFYYY